MFAHTMLQHTCSSLQAAKIHRAEATEELATPINVNN